MSKFLILFFQCESLNQSSFRNSSHPCLCAQATKNASNRCTGTHTPPMQIIMILRYLLTVHIEYGLTGIGNPVRAVAYLLFVRTIIFLTSLLGIQASTLLANIKLSPLRYCYVLIYKLAGKIKCHQESTKN
jgi:hypothetical protein